LLKPENTKIDRSYGIILETIKLVISFVFDVALPKMVVVIYKCTSFMGETVKTLGSTESGYLLVYRY